MENVGLITAVAYDRHHRHIVEVEYLPIDDGVPGKKQRLSRRGVLKERREGRLFFTAVPDPDQPGEWDVALVKRHRVNGVVYLTTAPDDSEADNLGELPEFEADGLYIYE